MNAEKFWRAWLVCWVLWSVYAFGVAMSEREPDAGPESASAWDLEIEPNSSLEGLRDVTLTQPNRYDILVFNGDRQRWETVPGPCASIPTPKGCE